MLCKSEAAMNEASTAVGSGYLTPERIMMRDLAREFTRDEVTPIANRLDPERGDIPRELIARMGELGFFGILIPEEFGGLGLGAFEYCLVAEELSRGWMSVASLLARGNEFYKSVPGTPAERQQKITAMLRGDYLGAINIGVLSRTAPIASSCSAASTTPRPARRPALC
jgi:alkylation response protein AidB-like acyl-CoA dehydrogenase